MRNPKRIDEILKELKTYWNYNPALQLDQILCNTKRIFGLDNLEDDLLLKILQECNKKEKYISEYAKKFREAYKRLDEMESLPTDWNRTGLKAISSDLIKNCRYILDQLKYPPHIVAPSKDGFVQFEFARQDRNYLDVNIRLGSVEVFRIKNDGIADYTEKREMYAPVEKISAFVVFCVDEFRGEKNERP